MWSLINEMEKKKRTTFCMNDAFDLLYFITLAKLGEIIADCLVNFKSRSTLKLDCAAMEEKHHLTHFRLNSQQN